MKNRHKKRKNMGPGTIPRKTKGQWSGNQKQKLAKTKNKIYKNKKLN